jgi:hypothetical protein
VIIGKHGPDPITEDWRGPDMRPVKVFPWKDVACCYGEPLTAACGMCDGTGEYQDFGGPFDCGICDGTGRLPLPPVRECTSVP